MKLESSTMAIGLFNQFAKAMIAFAKDQTTLEIMAIQFADENENFQFTFESETLSVSNSRMSYSIEYRALLQATFTEQVEDLLTIAIYEKNGNCYSFSLTSD